MSHYSFQQLISTELGVKAHFRDPALFVRKQTNPALTVCKPEIERGGLFKLLTYQSLAILSTSIFLPLHMSFPPP